MTPITHPLAIAYLEAKAAYFNAPKRDNAEEAVASVRAYDAWAGAGYPLRLDPPKNTVKVRIVVAADAGGLWNCCGYSGATDAQLMDELCPDSDRVTWITAYVPLPEPAAAVVGEVEGG